MFSAGEGGTVVPLLTKAASAPWRPSHAGASNASHNSKQEAKRLPCEKSKPGRPGL